MRGVSHLAAIAILAGALAAAPPARASVEAGARAYERQDYIASLKLLRPEAERGNARAQYLVGRHYQFGQGTRASLTEAYYWYRRAELGGHAEGKLFRQLLVQHWKISRADRMAAERRVAFAIDVNRTERAVAALSKSHSPGHGVGESALLRGTPAPGAPPANDPSTEPPPVVAEKPPSAKPPAAKPPSVAAKLAPKPPLVAKAPPVRVPTIAEAMRPAAPAPRPAVPAPRPPQEHATAVVPPSAYVPPPAPPPNEEHANEPSLVAPVAPPAIAAAPMMDDWAAPPPAAFVPPAYVPPAYPPPVYAPPVYAPRVYAPRVYAPRPYGYGYGYAPAYRPPGVYYAPPAYRPWRPPVPYVTAGHYRAPAYAPRVTATFGYRYPGGGRWR